MAKCSGTNIYGNKIGLNPLHAIENIKNVSAIEIISPYGHDTDSWNLSSSLTRTYIFYIVNTMDADALATQGAGISNNDIDCVEPE